MINSYIYSSKKGCRAKRAKFQIFGSPSGHHEKKWDGCDRGIIRQAKTSPYRGGCRLRAAVRAHARTMTRQSSQMASWPQSVCRVRLMGREVSGVLAVVVKLDAQASVSAAAADRWRTMRA